jgi:phosphotransacetylase
MQQSAKEPGVSLDRVTLVDPTTMKEQDACVQLLHENRKSKGLSLTATTIRAALYLVGLTPGNKTLSSFFVMVHPDQTFLSNDPRVELLSFSTKSNGKDPIVDKVI